MGISINNFSMELGDTFRCIAPVDFSVEIIDPIYDITLSGTYFTNNGIVVDSFLNVTSGGYIMTYNTIPSGNMLLVANASNSNGDYLSNIYELQYGYEVTWEEVKCWGPLKEVPISVIATNAVLAPNASYFSTFFITKKAEEANLEVAITAEGSGYQDLMISVKPQSKYFLSGNTYTVTISGIRDFSGNQLPAKIFSFNVE